MVNKLKTLKECVESGYYNNGSPIPQKYLQAYKSFLDNPDKARKTFDKCIHKGEVQRMVECQSCSGKVEIKVFRCSKFNEATIGFEIENVACCRTCEIYEETK